MITPEALRTALLNVIRNIDPNEHASVREYWIERYNATFVGTPYGSRTGDMAA